MKQAAISTKRKDNNLIILFISAICITLFLFFIDEGYYNFKWMASGMNWLIFVIYATVIFLVELLLFKLFPRKYQDSGLALWVVIGMVLLGIFYLIVTLWANW